MDILKLSKWIEMSKELKDLKTKEFVLRRELCSDILRGLSPPCKRDIKIEQLEMRAESTVTHVLDAPMVNQII